MSLPILSVIIPTHNRSSYAVPTISSLLSISADIEIVVSDTSELDCISQHFIDDERWSRVRLIRPGIALSVVDNFNEGLKHATGEYLLFLGDDDFVTSNVISLLHWTKKNQIDALHFKFPIHYYWPDFKHKRRGDSLAGTLSINRFTGSIQLHDSKKALRDAAENLGGGIYNMPRAYAGIVSRELVALIVGKHGFLFGGVSPDIFSAALIADNAKNCISIDYPIIIPGSSGASTAGQSANGLHVGGLRDNAHIRAFKNLVWDDLVPEFYSVPTVWGYSLLRALELVSTPVNPNYGRMYVRCFLYHRRYISYSLISIKSAARKLGVSRLLLLLASGGFAEVRWIVTKVLTLIFNRYKSTREHVVPQIHDTSDALRSVSKILLEISPKFVLPKTLTSNKPKDQ